MKTKKLVPGQLVWLVFFIGYLIHLATPYSDMQVYVIPITILVLFILLTVDLLIYLYSDKSESQ